MRAGISVLVLTSVFFSATAGTWTPVANPAPDNISTMLLLSDGTVMAANDGGNSWYRLTPDIHGSYAAGTWTTLASMRDSRLYYSSDVLTNGQVFVAGAEYGTGTNSSELYDPVADRWTAGPTLTGGQFLDSESKLLADGNVLVAPVYPVVSGTAVIYNVASNRFFTTPHYVRGSYQDEACWVKLPDNSILTIDPFGTNSERYVPSLGAWIDDGGIPVSLYASDGELGPGFLLPDGRAFFLGGTTNTAFYTPSGTTNRGTWAAGPIIPNGLGAPDAPAAMMANGKILCALGPAGTFSSPTSFYEYDYVSNLFTAIIGPDDGSYPPFITRMLDLPDGTVLFSGDSSQIYVYQPDGPLLSAGRPTITGLVTNNDGSYRLTGSSLDGISEGAAYGDDAQMDTDYPIVRLTNSSGVFYARTYNWPGAGVMASNTTMTTAFTVPENVPGGVFSLFVTANGVSSSPVPFSPDPLRISPATAISWTIGIGSTNSFTKTYTLTNAGAVGLTWSLVNTSGWFNLSKTGGTLAAGSTTTLTASLNVTNLSTGLYTGRLAFSNVTSHFPHTLPANLSVLFADGSPVTLTGFNRDVVVERTAAGGDTAPYAQPFDSVNAFTFFEAGLSAINYTGGNPTVEGMPTNRLVTSALDGATVFQLMPYNANNALYLTNGSSSGTLTLSTPTAYNSLSILATTANGAAASQSGSTGTLVLHFVNGATSAPLAFYAPDWFDNAGAGLTHVGEIYAGNYGAFYTDNPAGNDPNFYQTTINLAALALNTNKITSITFTMPSGTGTYSSTATGIFAVSGSVFQRPSLSAARNGNVVRLNWGAYTNQMYQLQFTTNLALNSWINVNSAVTGTNSTMSVTDTNSTDLQRYYRLKLSSP